MVDPEAKPHMVGFGKLFSVNNNTRIRAKFINDLNPNLIYQEFYFCCFLFS